MCTIFLICSVLLAKLSLREVKDGPTSVLAAASADFDNGENALSVVILILFLVVFVIFFILISTTRLQDEYMNIWRNSVRGKRQNHRLSYDWSSCS